MNNNSGFQMLLLIVVVQWFGAKGTPLFQGISFQRGFELNFKPLPRKPLSFIKEKWSPFGVFGRRFGIQKRSIGSGVPVPQGASELRQAAPVFEHVDEIEHVETLPLKVLPPQTPRSLIPVHISPPVPPPGISSIPLSVSSPAPPPIPLHVIITPAPKPVLSDVPQQSIYPAMSVVTPPTYSPLNRDVLPPAISAPVPEVNVLPVSSNMVIPPAKIVNNDVRPPLGLYTDISRVEPVKENMNSVQPVAPPITVEEKVAPPIVTNSIKPETPKNDNIVLNDSSLIRGSRLALYFGNIFLQLMSQFMTNARATFDQITNPPPVFNN